MLLFLSLIAGCYRLGSRTASITATKRDVRARTEPLIVNSDGQDLEESKEFDEDNDTNEVESVDLKDDIDLVQELYVPGWFATPSKTQVCSDEKSNGTILLVTVISAPENIAQRQAIRASWGRFGRRRKDVQIVYLVGRSNRLDKELKQEAEKFSDLVVNNIYDSYENLTLKTLSAFKWHEE